MLFTQSQVIVEVQVGEHKSELGELEVDSKRVVIGNWRGGVIIN